MRLLLSVIIIALTIRVLLPLVYGEPFSTDVWPLIRITNKLVENPDIRIWFDEELGGYNNRWPGIILSVAVYSIISGMSIKFIYGYVYPCTLFLVVLISLYSMFRYVARASKLAIVMGLLYFSLVPSLLVFTSAGLKEVYAYPLFYLLLPLSIREVRFNSMLAILLLAIALVMSHHFATLALISLLFSTSWVYLSYKLAGSRVILDISLKPIIVTAITITLLFITYLLLYGLRGMVGTLDLIDPVGIIFYGTTLYIGYLVYCTLGSSRQRIMIQSMIMIALILLMSAATTGIPLLPGFTLPSHTSLLPYIVPILASFALLLIRRNGMGILRLFIVGSILFITASTMYVVLYKPELASIIHRVMNYLVLTSTFILVNSFNNSYRASKTLGKSRTTSSTTSSPLAALTIILVTIASTSIVLGNILSGNDYVVHYWVYSRSEVIGINSVVSLHSNAYVIVGDAKIYYFLNPDIEVNSLKALRFLKGGDLYLHNNTLLVVYKDNYVKGYVVSLNLYKIPLASISQANNRIYDCGTIQAYVG